MDFKGEPMIFIGFFEAHRGLTGATAPTCLYLGAPLHVGPTHQLIQSFDTHRHPLIGWKAGFYTVLDFIHRCISS